MLSKFPTRFFNSTQFQKHMLSGGAKSDTTTTTTEVSVERFKLDSFLYPRIGQHSLQVIYEICTRHFFLSSSSSQKYCEEFQLKQEPFLIHLLSFVNKLLDTAYGLQGFCNFFASSSDNNSSINSPTLLDQLVFSPSSDLSLERLDTMSNNSKFLVLFITTYKSTSLEYFMQMLTIVNKLLKINYQINRSLLLKKPSPLELSSNSSSLISSVASSSGTQSRNITFLFFIISLLIN